MSIKQNGGVFGRNPTFNDVTIEGDLIINGEVFTGLDFQGSWNASTNSPALASSVGTNGEFYIVSVAGGTNLNGITNWGIGDWAIFNGTAWQRVEGGADGNFNALTANSLTVNGTATMDGLNLGDSEYILAGTGADLKIGHDGTGNIIRAQNGPLYIDANGTTFRGYSPYTNHMSIASNGDVSFYDTAGSTAKLFWDASAESLGIGTSSPNAPLEATKAITFSNADTIGQFLIKSAAGATGDMLNFGVDSTNSLAFIQANERGVDTIPLVLQRYGGNVGIGTSSPTSLLTTNVTADGAIHTFSKSGTTVGSIGTNSNTTYIDGSSANTGLQFAGSAIAPRDSGALSDAGVDLGNGSYRFKDLYLSGGVYLGGTGAANLLDDYEEGLHDVVLTPSTSGSLTVGGASNAVAYTKVGQLVTITGNITVTAVSSPVGIYVDISLPFAISSKTDQAERFGSAFTFFDFSSSIFSTEPMQGVTGSVVRMQKDAATWAVSDQVYFSFSYTTDL